MKFSSLLLTVFLQAVTLPLSTRADTGTTTTGEDHSLTGVHGHGNLRKSDSCALETCSADVPCCDGFECTESSEGVVNMTCQPVESSTSIVSTASAFTRRLHYSYWYYKTPEIELAVYNAATNTKVKTLSDGESYTINKEVMPKWTVVAEVVSGYTEKVKFFLNGNWVRTEEYSPYALGSDWYGNFAPVNLNPGKYEVSAIPYDRCWNSGDKKRAHIIVSDYVEVPSLELKLINIYTGKIEEVFEAGGTMDTDDTGCTTTMADEDETMSGYVSLYTFCISNSVTPVTFSCLAPTD